MSEEQYNIDNVESHLDGVLWYDGNPVYIIKLVKKFGVRTAVVYNYSERDYKNFKVVRPDWAPVDANAAEQIKENSVFSEKYNRKISRKTINVEKPSIYSAPILEGTSTITGKIQEGFYERVRVRSRTGYAYQPSGAFIGMDDITWEEGGKLNLNDLMEEASRVSREALYEKYGIRSHEDGVYF